MGDESRDISGKEQLSIGIRFYDQKKQVIREEFVGFVELDAMDARTIAFALDEFIVDAGLDPHKFKGQGYEGCSTMSGQDNGVQAILREKYPHALYFHCASHKLNLVVNDLNQVPEIRNSIATIKDVINFFRDSITRRKYVPNIPDLCKTRWSKKYKSIAIFKKHFKIIVGGLAKLSIEGNSGTRSTAFQLHSAVTQTTFIICLVLIAKYSTYLEPIVNVLQSQKLDLLACTKHVQKIIQLAKDHRKDVDSKIEELFDDSKSIAEENGVELRRPRTVNSQKHRSNHPSSNEVQFWKRSLLIPYLDSLITALERRFSVGNLPAYSLFQLHPANMLKMNIHAFIEKSENFTNFYALQSFSGEAELWYDHWKGKKMSCEDLQKLDLCDVVQEAGDFFPTTKLALHIALALPCTTSSIEITFSKLRRVKTWRRSTMVENRLNGLCMLSVHRKKVKENEKKIVDKVLEIFAEDPRRLALI